jgi:Bacterial transcriptional activator domain
VEWRAADRPRRRLDLRPPRGAARACATRSAQPPTKPRPAATARPRCGSAGATRALDPLAEEPHHELIRRLVHAGDRAAALVVYDRLVRRLREQLHTTPSRATRELVEALRSGLPVDVPGTVADERGTDARDEPIGPAKVGLALPRQPASLSAVQAHRWEAISADGPARLHFNLPSVVASFVGRETELGAIDEALSAADHAVITQAITGLGGVGKSQLAARYVQQRAESYDLVAWIRAEDGGIADLAELAVKLGASRDEISPHELAQLALDWLGDGQLRWLLVLDKDHPYTLRTTQPRRRLSRGQPARRRNRDLRAAAGGERTHPRYRPPLHALDPRATRRRLRRAQG